jgi:solute carrier family 25 phosphate transporter 23/24/25/41
MGSKISVSGKMTDEELRELFEHLDRNGDGVIDENELRLAVQEFDLPASDSDVKRLMKMVDLNNSNDIDFEEFKYFMHISHFWLQVGTPGRSQWLAMNTKLENMGKTFLAGGLAGAISRSTVAPLERIKILFQTQGHPPKYVGIGQALSVIWKEEGLRGYFKGNGANVLRIFPSSAIHFATYEHYKNMLFGDRQDLRPEERLLAGAMAGTTGQVVCYPLEFMRARLSVQTSKVYNGIFDGFRKVIKQEGFFALYRGLWPSLVGVVPYVGIDFAVYEHLKGLVPKNKDGSVWWGYFLACGGTAGAVAQTVAYPLDLVRRRIQVQGFTGATSGGGGGVNTRHYTGMIDAFVKIYKYEGIRGFYQGLWPNYVKVVPAMAVSFLVYEELRMVLGLTGPAKAPT